MRTSPHDSQGPNRGQSAAKRDIEVAHYRGFNVVYSNLHGRGFRLGDVQYVVAHQQAHPTRVRCYREYGNVVTVVNLPLIFVLEQLADEVRLEEPA